MILLSLGMRLSTNKLCRMFWNKQPFFVILSEAKDLNLRQYP